MDSIWPSLLAKQVHHFMSNPNNKMVLMIHGWEDQVGTFGGLMDLLKNYCVVFYDGSAHGRSSKGNTSTF